MSSVVAPSDVSASKDDGALLHIGGRVVYKDAINLVLADAYRQLTLHVGSTSVATSPGDLLVVTARVAHGQLELLDVVAHQACPEPTRSSEFSARALSPRGAHLHARSRAKRAVHDYFESQHFVEVDTPSVVPSPGLDAHVSSFGAVPYKERSLFLITSPEFHMKRLLSAGMPRIYQICHCFRAEEQGPWHEPEFTMVEWYRAFATWQDTMADTEALMRGVADVIASDEIRRLLEAPFERMSVTDAFATFAGTASALDLAESDEQRYFQILVDLVEPALARLPRPVFLTHYPTSQSGLALACPDDERSAQRYELYFRGLELCNGFSELTDAIAQRRRFESELERRTRTGEPAYPIDEQFLAALAQGVPPSSGNALGFDRLVAALLDVEHLESVSCFTDRER